VEVKLAGRKQILFAGDSLIAFFDWQVCFSDFDCVNLGVPGETVQGWRGLVEQAARRYNNPAYLVVMLGANNICQQDYSFLPSYEALLADFRKVYPAVEIIVCSLLPHELPWLHSSAVVRLNESLQVIAEDGKNIFLDICTDFLEQQPGCFEEDGVHLSKKGYEIWSNVLTLFFKDCSAKHV
jgi:lysophospholipase L1-like esterase